MTILSEEDYFHVKRRIKSFTKLLNLHQNVFNYREKLSKFLPKHLLQELSKVEEVCNKLFPGNFDIQFVYKPEIKRIRNTYGSNHQLNMDVLNAVVPDFDYIKLIILFPKLTLTNSDAQTHTIRDFVVNIKLHYDTDDICLKFDLDNATRLTVDEMEYRTNYVHSHVNSKNYTSLFDQDITFNRLVPLGGFCTGEGDINIVISELNSSAGSGNVDIEMLEMFFHQLVTYLEWESKEGGPFILMHSIYDNHPSIVKYNPNSGIGVDLADFMTYIKETVREDYSRINLNWIITCGKYEIVDDEVFEDFLINMAVIRQLETMFLYQRAANGTYFRKRANQVSQLGNLHFIPRNNEWLPFRGQKLWFKLERVVIDQPVEIIKYYFHPKLKSYVKQQLEYQANKEKVRDTAFSRLNQCLHIG